MLDSGLRRIISAARFRRSEMTKLLGGLSGQSLDLVEQIGSAESQFSGKSHDVEAGNVDISFDKFRGLGEQVAVDGICRERLGTARFAAEVFLLEIAAVEDQIVATHEKQLRIEWFGDIVVRPGRKALQGVCLGVTGRQQHYWNMTGYQGVF